MQGKYFEVPISRSLERRTRIHCYFLPERRVAKPVPGETNYQIFYTTLAGMNIQDREKFGLAGKDVSDFRSLNHSHKMVDNQELKNLFDAWKTSLDILGISYQDVMQILAGCLLLANLEFESEGDEEIKTSSSQDHLKNLCEQLGLSVTSLVDSLTKKYLGYRGETVCHPLNVEQVLITS